MSATSAWSMSPLDEASPGAVRSAPISNGGYNQPHPAGEWVSPCNAFDLDKVAGRSITVRRAQAGEKITTLDEKEFYAEPANLVICDAESRWSMAGIMGAQILAWDDIRPTPAV